jgi:hypothetical protein
MRLNLLSIFAVLVFSLSAFSKGEKLRAPNSEDASVSQVQLCPGTEAFGNEGQGMAVSAFINYHSEKDFETNTFKKTCELGLAFSFEYGSDHGFKIGNATPFNIYPVNAGKTECLVSEEGNGATFFTLVKAVSKNSKVKRAPKVLIERCKLTSSGT